MSYIKKYFAGGNTPKGGVNFFKNIIPPSSAERIYCIKGGPGVGKSTFMKKMAEEFLKKGEDISLFYCPSDPKSLDGVCADNLKIAFIDGTAPHITDPVYPGAVDEILDFGRFFNTDKLRENKKAITELTDRTAEWFALAKEKLKPISSVMENLQRIYKKYENEKAVLEVYEDIKENLFKDKRGENPVKRELFLSGITPDGIVSFASDTLKYYNVISLEAEAGDASKDICDMIVKDALEKGFYTECFYCPLSPFKKIDHIVIPELSSAISVSNSYHLFDGAKKVYNINKCYNDILDKSGILKSKETLNKLIYDCTERLSKARELHSELEKYYINAMDYEKLNSFSYGIREKLKID